MDVGHRTITLLARDHHAICSLAADFYVNGGVLGVVSSDVKKNISIFEYNPDLRDDRQTVSRTGERTILENNSVLLLRSSDIHCGETVKKFLRIPATDDARVQGLTFGTGEGSVGVLLPLKLSEYQTLEAVQEHLLYELPQPCGLNPLAHRCCTETYPPGCPEGGILDGNLLWKYFLFSFLFLYSYFFSLSFIFYFISFYVIQYFLKPCVCICVHLLKC